MNLVATRRIADGGLGFEFYVFVAGSQAFLISMNFYFYFYFYFHVCEGESLK